MCVEHAQPKCGRKPKIKILEQFWPALQNRVEPAQPEFWKNIKQVEPAQLKFSRGNLRVNMPDPTLKRQTVANQ